MKAYPISPHNTRDTLSPGTLSPALFFELVSLCGPYTTNWKDEIRTAEGVYSFPHCPITAVCYAALGALRLPMEYKDAGECLHLSSPLIEAIFLAADFNGYISDGKGLTGNQLRKYDVYWTLARATHLIPLLTYQPTRQED